MARNANGSDTLDITATVEAMKARIERIKELGKLRTQLDKDQEALDKQQLEIDAELAALTGGTATPESKPRKPRSDAGKPRANGNGVRGTSLRAVLLKVMPNPDSDGITKDDISTLIAAEGYTTTASDPKVVIGQTLGKFRDFQNVSRGLWRLSKFGVTTRDKMLATGNEPVNAPEDEHATPVTDDAAPVAETPAPEAPAAEATPAPAVAEAVATA